MMKNNTNKTLNRDELKKSLSTQKPSIKVLLAKLEKPPKTLRFFLTVRGELMLATKQTKLIPFAQEDVKNWHYDISIKPDLDIVSKSKTKWPTELADQLIRKMKTTVENTYWYFGNNEVV
jgi:hypothetical protein